MPQLGDLHVSIEDRQALTLLEDDIANLQLILPTMLGTVIGLREEFQSGCGMSCSDQHNTCGCDDVLHQFDIHRKEIEICQTC